MCFETVFVDITGENSSFVLSFEPSEAIRAMVLISIHHVIFHQYIATLRRVWIKGSHDYFITCSLNPDLLIFPLQTSNYFKTITLYTISSGNQII